MLSSLVIHPVKARGVQKLVSEIDNDLGEEYEVMAWQELSPDLVNMIETDRMEGYVFMFILYMVISFGIFGTMLMMMSERKREFGVLIAVGMKRWKLGAIVFMELFIISIMGALAGTLAAFPICAYFHYNPIHFGEELSKITEEYGMEAVLQSSIDPAVFIQQALVVILIATVISFYPIFRLLKMDVINSMRS